MELHFLDCCYPLYKLFVLLVILSRVLLTDCIISSTADKNLWLVFQYKREAIELAMGAVLLYCTADFRMLWKCMKHI